MYNAGIAQGAGEALFSDSTKAIDKSQLQSWKTKYFWFLSAFLGTQDLFFNPGNSLLIYFF